MFLEKGDAKEEEKKKTASLFCLVIRWQGASIRARKIVSEQRLRRTAPATGCALPVPFAGLPGFGPGGQHVPSRKEIFGLLWIANKVVTMFTIFPPNGG